jgi:hypothetical protein
VKAGRAANANGAFVNARRVAAHANGEFVNARRTSGDANRGSSESRATMNRRGRLPALVTCALVLAPLAACDKQGAYGEANSIIVATDTGLWAQVDTLRDALEPRIRTVRDERMFEGKDPFAEHWGDLRRFKQILLVGAPDDAWMEPAVSKLAAVPQPPAIAQVPNVWARSQVVTLLLLPRDGARQAALSLAPLLRDVYDEQYRAWAVNRMFTSGRNTALADELRREAGFALLLPNVYRTTREQDAYVFRNDQPDPSELIREVTVAWRSLSAAGDPTLEQLLAWRDELIRRRQDFPQLVDAALVETAAVEASGVQALQLQGVWRNPPEAEWPAGGPFVLRAVPCPEQDRLYLLDAWLYAPGKRKYEFMIQLETILRSFECGG